jgi:hypothetical protein
MHAVESRLGRGDDDELGVLPPSGPGVHGGRVRVGWTGSFVEDQYLEEDRALAVEEDDFAACVDETVA